MVQHPLGKQQSETNYLHTNLTQTCISKLICLYGLSSAVKKKRLSCSGHARHKNSILKGSQCLSLSFFPEVINPLTTKTSTRRLDRLMSVRALSLSERSLPHYIDIWQLTGLTAGAHGMSQPFSRYTWRHNTRFCTPSLTSSLCVFVAVWYETD